MTARRDADHLEGPMLETFGLTKRYGGVTVVEDVSIRLATGTKTALLGPNGAGKTTLLAMLSTLAVPSDGDATIAGHLLSRNPAALRRSFGVLAHSPMLYEEFTPLENLRFFGRLYGVDDVDGRCEELLRAVGLWGRRFEETQVLSRGQHQRLALARALIHRPPLLLLDEPETGLDTDGMALLDDLMLHAPEVTVLAATHRVERVATWADGTVVMQRGRVVEDTASALEHVPAARAAAAGAAS